MTPTNVKHAVFEASRHGDGSAKVQIVGPFGIFGIVVPAAGNSEHLSEHQKIEALRNALGAMGEASERLEDHLRHIDPEGSKPEEPMESVPPDAHLA